MRLSEAIALGRTTIPRLISANLEGCAMGMAANAVSCGLSYLALSKVWPWLYGKSFRCPQCDERGEDNAMNIIVHLFDHHIMWNPDLTLDQLIDWVRSVEPQETTESVSIEATRVEVCAK